MAFDLVKEMVTGTEFGQTLGQGIAYTGNKLGVKRIPVVKGQSLAAYDRFFGLGCPKSKGEKIK